MSKYQKTSHILSKEAKYLASIVGLGLSGGVEVAYFSLASLQSCIDKARLRDCWEKRTVNSWSINLKKNLSI